MFCSQFISWVTFFSLKRSKDSKLFIRRNWRFDFILFSFRFLFSSSTIIPLIEMESYSKKITSLTVNAKSNKTCYQLPNGEQCFICPLWQYTITSTYSAHQKMRFDIRINVHSKNTLNKSIRQSLDRIAII